MQMNTVQTLPTPGCIATPGSRLQPSRVSQVHEQQPAGPLRTAKPCNAQPPAHNQIAGEGGRQFTGLQPVLGGCQPIQLVAGGQLKPRKLLLRLLLQKPAWDPHRFAAPERHLKCYADGQVLRRVDDDGWLALMQARPHLQLLRVCTHPLIPAAAAAAAAFLEQYQPQMAVVMLLYMMLTWVLAA